MSDYVIFTDSACDIPTSVLAAWDIKYCCQTFVFDDSEHQYSNYDMPANDFYDRMRNGGVAKTSAINSDTFRLAFTPELAAGRDVLYIAFSSGLSATYDAGRIAAMKLQAAYPQRKIIAVDSLSGSAGLGLLLYLTDLERKNGATIEQAAHFAEDLRLHICHWFTVDDLVYLKRGGRIGSAAAFVGGLLKIKPVLHVNDEGRLVSKFKVSGRHAALKALANQYGKLAAGPDGGTVFLSHGSCPEDARTLRKMLVERFDASVPLIVDIGPVIGAHSGPGTLALFFIGKER